MKVTYLAFYLDGNIVRKVIFFVAYNEAWGDASIGNTSERELQLENRVLVIKVTYLYRL